MKKKSSTKGVRSAKELKIYDLGEYGKWQRIKGDKKQHFQNVDTKETVSYRQFLNKQSKNRGYTNFNQEIKKRAETGFKGYKTVRYVIENRYVLSKSFEHDDLFIQELYRLQEKYPKGVGYIVITYRSNTGNSKGSDKINPRNKKGGINSGRAQLALLPEEFYRLLDSIPNDASDIRYHVVVQKETVIK